MTALATGLRAALRGPGFIRTLGPDVDEGAQKPDRLLGLGGQRAFDSSTVGPIRSSGGGPTHLDEREKPDAPYLSAGTNGSGKER